MEGMLHLDAAVAGQALDRHHLFPVRGIVWIESGVAGDADEFAVGRMIEDGIFHEERNLLSLPLLRERVIAMACEAVGSRLGMKHEHRRQKKAAEQTGEDESLFFHLERACPPPVE